HKLFHVTPNVKIARRQVRTSRRPRRWASSTDPSLRILFIQPLSYTSKIMGWAAIMLVYHIDSLD
ncbi:unnamed protein product, partial [Acanthoscelides obtectus]